MCVLGGRGREEGAEEGRWPLLCQLLPVVPLVPEAFDFTCLSPPVYKSAAIVPPGTPAWLLTRSRQPPHRFSRLQEPWHWVGGSGLNQTRTRNQLCPEY